MDLKVDGGSSTSMTEVKLPQWTGVDIRGSTDIDVDVLTAVHLRVPRPYVCNGEITTKIRSRTEG